MKRIALVLGGGGARGLAHINVLEAFDELGVKPDAIAGSSIGAIIGAAYAAGMSAREMREYAIATFGHRAEVMSRLWRLRPESLRSMINRAPRLGELDAQRVLRAFLPRDIPETFQELDIPLKITATDFYGSSTTVIDKGDLWRAMAASAAIPALFRPVIIDGRVQVDGGISNPVAFDLFDDRDYFIIAVDVVGKPTGDAASIPSRFDAAFGANQLMMQSLTQFKLKLHEPQVLIRPDIDSFRVLDFMLAEQIFETTESSRAEALKALGKFLENEPAVKESA